MFKTFKQRLSDCLAVTFIDQVISLQARGVDAAVHMATLESDGQAFAAVGTGITLVPSTGECGVVPPV
jgi:predicted Rossmann fold nucleotide-binding protein DprA/Smf involved in DNA uptake